jgi:hypothetical protein
LVTRSVNLRRGDAGNYWRTRTHCIHGHPFEGDNLSLKARNRRRCLTCHRNQETARRTRRRNTNAG